jgi:hypothetical protein
MKKSALKSNVDARSFFIANGLQTDLNLTAGNA